ncbi:MAG TPA: 5-methyltetrahydropteroyltriglutamate--homocysteine S-methyltransferase [Actinomycetales bacterium]|nr:5-methyltetrahydropteroyltriglutamate--homocysteine S-methyltransferase [Actinomycetales bacterium]
MTTTLPSATVLGYPRIGRDRETKKAVEAFWAGRSDAAALATELAEVRRQARTRMVELGLEPTGGAIPSDATAYDHVLDAATTFGAIPARFAHLADESGRLDAAGYFTLARGEGDLAPLEMTKWFDSNYHYLVPEISPTTTFAYVDQRIVAEYREAAAEGTQIRPVLVGPVSFLLLAKEEVGDGGSDAYATAGAERTPFIPLDRLDDLVADGDVPAERVVEATRRAYEALGAVEGRPSILLTAPYGELREALPAVAAAPVEAVGLDLVRGTLPQGESAELFAGKTVVAGVVSGRNIWRADLAGALATLEKVQAMVGEEGSVVVGTSTSLLHVPHDAARESALDPDLRSWLAFADQKVGEVVTLARGLAEGPDAVAAEVQEAADAIANRDAHPGTHRVDVRERTAAIDDGATTRVPYDARAGEQHAALNLPDLPTTTIGSFPQTSEIRRARAAHRRGELDDAGYTQAMKDEIAQVVRLQEDLGIDVLVHGEAERNDMVQYFAELLDGFATTQHGWVQSYGSRCTRPSLLWGDVSRPAPMTVEWTSYAQSLTEKPMKGMLTGPVTILAWSFVRDDQPLGETANQVALALRDEVADLEIAGIKVIQVDEPALRELLPLREEDQAQYLDWSVRAFRVATAGAAPATQIHTHLCYSEFSEIIDAIDGLDADVTSIEAARSKMEILPAVREAGFDREIGPGVYDIHSPRVPDVEELAELLAAAQRAIPGRQLWVNPDCGLKTRGYAEVTPSLTNMVAAARAARGE